jgi:hypothetical protein
MSERVCVITGKTKNLFTVPLKTDEGEPYEVYVNATVCEAIAAIAVKGVVAKLIDYRMENHSTDYRIIQEDTCRRCEGRKMIEHPKWENYYKRLSSYAQKHATVDSLDDFSKDFWKGWDELPPQEIECPDCGGEGIVKREVFIDAVLAAILDGRA